MEKKINKGKNGKIALLTTLICLLPMVAGMILYKRLPDQIPTKWYADGTVGQYMDKAVTVFGMPAFMAAMNLLLHFGLNTDPKRQKMSSALRKIAFGTCPVLSLLVGAGSLAWGLGIPFPVDKVIPVLIGFLFIAVGNYLPKCKQNYTMGIKLPWTLHSEENWNKTHRLAGYIWILAGVLMILLGIFQRKMSGAVSVGVIAIVLIAALIPSAYSYVLYRRGV